MEKVGVKVDSLPELQAFWVYTPHSLVEMGLPRDAILTHSRDPLKSFSTWGASLCSSGSSGSFMKYKVPGLIAPNSPPFSEVVPPSLPHPAQKFHSGGLG